MDARTAQKSKSLLGKIPYSANEGARPPLKRAHKPLSATSQPISTEVRLGFKEALINAMSEGISRMGGVSQNLHPNTVVDYVAKYPGICHADIEGETAIEIIKNCILSAEDFLSKERAINF